MHSSSCLILLSCGEKCLKCDNDCKKLRAAQIGRGQDMESHILTLFGDPKPAGRGPSGFLVSMVVHVVVIGSLYLNLKHRVRVEDEAIVQRYTVRLLSLWRPEPKVPRPVENHGTQSPQRGAGEVASGGQPSAPSLPFQVADRIPAPQTLVQPDLPPNLVLPQETPIPLILMWSPESSTARQIVLPPPQEKTVAEVRPDLNPPNHEVELADMRISASAFVTDKALFLPSTTSPVVVHGTEEVKQVPETTSKPLGAPVPARVLSLSDLVLERGTIALPMVNETAAVGASDAMAPAREVSSPDGGHGNKASKQDGIGAGETPGSQTGKGAGPDNPGRQEGAKGGPENPGRQEGAKSEPDSGASEAAEAGSSAEPTVTRIVMPKDGKFGVVIVGSSMAEEYPETVGLWGSRMAYTVYLHVGVAKSWILQYSLPQAADNGTTGRIDAPWPFVMERPGLAPGDLNGDAIMVHGFVSTSGRFEKLAIVFPADFAQGKFVLGALQQWQFRAAMQNGLLTAVEVLLIIPAEAAQ
jgi:hypothetical protein